jgi:small subunit ribosomal protein S5
MAKKNFKELRKDEEFEQRTIDLARVTRVTSGGKRMRFRACIGIGNKSGKFGVGVAKGADVSMAITKGFNQAKKNIINIPIVNGTIPHPVLVKYRAAKVLLKPARKGTGIKVGGAVRILCELSGIANITGKILGSKNKINNVKAAMIALQSFKKVKRAEAEQIQEKK